MPYPSNLMFPLLQLGELPISKARCKSPCKWLDLPICKSIHSGIQIHHVRYNPNFSQWIRLNKSNSKHDWTSWFFLFWVLFTYPKRRGSPLQTPSPWRIPSIPSIPSCQSTRHARHQASHRAKRRTEVLEASGNAKNAQRTQQKWWYNL